MKRLATYSQYFLRSPDLIKELLGHSTIKKTDTVYDIGAGSGAITAVLAQRVEKVIAIEIEPRMYEKLRENMHHFANVTVLNKDFLDMELPNKPYKIFANIPFHISSEIIHKLTETDRYPQAAYLIVQKQFARKLLIDSDYFTGQLGAKIAPLFRAKIRRPLRRTDYFPHPNVDTVLLEIVPRPEPLLSEKEMPAYRKMIEDCFADPKKFAKMPRQEIGLREGVKPSQMSLAMWLALFKASTRH